MPLINCEISLILTWPSTCVITSSSCAGIFALTDTKLNVPAVTLSTQDSAKLLWLLKSSFKITNNWNKYQSKATSQYLDYLVDPSFQGEIRLFVLPFEDNTHRTRHSIFSSKRRDKRLQCFDWWTKLLWSIIKKWSKKVS